MENNLSEKERKSIIYHDIFDYPLNISDLIKWQAGDMDSSKIKPKEIVFKRGFYFVKGKEGLIYKRSLRKRISLKKIKKAKKSAGLLSLIPTIQMVGITGSLAMENSTEESDIDLLIITKENTLWLTRAIALILLFLFGVKTRKAGNVFQTDWLCLNMWLDKSQLVWKKNERNMYTAHEIAQIIPIVNKNRTYELFLIKNKWISDYWPNAVRIQNSKNRKQKKTRKTFIFSFFCFLNKIAYRLQYLYMKSKITREIVSEKIAIFHPQDWSKLVLKRLS